LKWWISVGASFVKKVKEEDQPDKIKPLLMALQKTTSEEKEPMDIPTVKVEKADGPAMEKLNQRGVIILPVAQNSNYLKANFVTDTLMNNADLTLLLTLRKQLIWLKLGFTNIRDSDMAVIGQLQNLTWLNLQHTGISDKGLTALQSLHGLKYLNLVGTKITPAGILQLKELKSLRTLYLYGIKINKADWAALQNAFPGTRIDSGGYRVPTLPNDTIVIKAKKEY
jgi:Leucine-rich repeat (LRR) protein